MLPLLLLPLALAAPQTRRHRRHFIENVRSTGGQSKTPV
jgi:hypothetical protein